MGHIATGYKLDERAVCRHCGGPIKVGFDLEWYHEPRPGYPLCVDYLRVNLQDRRWRTFDENALAYPVIDEDIIDKVLNKYN